MLKIAEKNLTNTLDFEDLKVADWFGPKGSILDTVGRTPVVKINHIAPTGVSVFAKLEAFNPMGSVKDRIALGIIEAAEKSGTLKPGQTVIEATSGNTGIGLAMVCAQKGYPLVIVMAESFSVERRRLMRFLGAKVVLTPASEKGTGMVAKAEELAREHGWFLANQFSNPATAIVHAQTTAVEILADFQTNSLDYFVTGFGTGGTLSGVSETLRLHSPNTKIAVVEPDNVPMLASGKGNDSADGRSHSGFRPHPMQGWSPDFLSRFALEVRDLDIIDQYCGVSGEDALRTARDLARKEGILAGITGGATVAAALKIAETAPKGSNILAMVPDTGERYMSTPLFEDIAADMDASELDISRSTPGCRFDAAPKSAPVAAAKPITVSPKAASFVTDQISDPDQPIVLFALEWCEFCWSVRRMFAALNVPYKSVNLDAASFEGGQAFASDVRAALHDRTGVPTIPQIFVGGQHVGGATETFDAYNDSTLVDLFKTFGLTPATPAFDNAYALLPTWLQKR